MGYGGNLIWTAVFRSLNEADGKPIRVAHKPLLSDLLHGCLYERGADLSNDPVFRRNARLEFTEPVPKGPLARLVDVAFAGALRPPPVKRAYEHAVFALAERLSRRRPYRLVHVDMLIHSYAERQLKDRFDWKPGGHAIETILRRFGDPPAALAPEMYFGASEDTAAGRLLAGAGVEGPFVVVEPDTNREWFGELRAWPLERWQALVERMRAAWPDIAVVQVGVAGAPGLAGVVDLRGRTDFRLAALILRRSELFIGTESGLMHAAAAVDARAVIIWGGVTLPEFAGYPGRHAIVCNYVSCAPCGQFGWCDNDHACMRGIAVDQVFDSVARRLDDNNPRTGGR